MADNHIEIGEPELTAEDAVKQRLLGRIAVAAVVIVGLLGSLAMFDALYAPRAKAPPTLATMTPPAATEVKPAEPAPAEAAPPTAMPTLPAATPEVTTAAPAEPLAPLPSERLTKPATAQKALAHPPGAMAPPPTAAELQREMQRETARAGATKAAPAAMASAAHSANSANSAPPAPSRPLSQPPQPAQDLAAGKNAKPAEAPLTALLPTDQSQKQFALQLGVFSNFANAEELRSKLEAAGIPTTVEARVRAGPFATRGEADAARAKLRALGIEESIMVSVKR